MKQLFDSPQAESLTLPDADILFWRAVNLEMNRAALQESLIIDTPWCQEEITLWGKRHKQPRLTAWYGDNDLTYTYSGVTLRPTPWTPLLKELKHRIEVVTDCAFNSVLLNYYRDQCDGMGMHSDDERELGDNPTIASLSLGEERTFVLQHKTRRDLDRVKLPLPSGSLLLMRGGTQRHWKHGIPKERSSCGSRVNLTFRHIYP
ncbi:MAG: alpha-ketoglutarate-dependent dioxygenase AlkB [Pseudomonadota bacterium]